MRPRILALMGGPAVVPFARISLAAAEAKGASVTTLDVQALKLPLFGAVRGVPAGVKTLVAELKECDGILVAVPEIAGVLAPAVLNALVWASRPSAKPSEPALSGKVVSLVSVAAYEEGSGLRALTQLVGVLGGLGAMVLPYPVGLPAQLKGQELEAGLHGLLERVGESLVGTLVRIG